MSDIRHTTSPFGNFVVHAAAGTGKTWLLTSRIIHLLLTGAEPGAVLAITFTRKAAAEIQQRVMSRLFELAGCESGFLDRRLHDLGCEPDTTSRQRARHLYEDLLVSERPLRVTTFHAFCQELLQRFSLESGLPPGFQVVESTDELENTAWQAFERALHQDPEGTTSRSMERLLRLTGNPTATRASLFSFINHRSDWWSFTEHTTDPVAFAQQQIAAVLTPDGATAPLADAGSKAIVHSQLQRYAELLSRHETKTNRDNLVCIGSALARADNDDALFNLQDRLFLDSKGRRKHIKPSKTLNDKLGADGAAELIALHETIADRLDQWRDHLRAVINLERNRSWIECGHALLDHFQKIKLQRGVLDFSDLEWRAYRLLSDSAHAQWVQYKLDQRIDHLLVDEFQDTNPTQWHLLLPLLDEMAAGAMDRQRSAFIVGDIKQSIYRFRRAAPDLFHHAREWLTINMNAQSASQQKSYRSSPAIIEFVNMVFGAADAAAAAQYRLHDFDIHAAHHTQRRGTVELLPLVPRPTTEADTSTAMRNPLHRPRARDENITASQHRQEAEMVAARIQALIGQAISTDEGTRALGYGDIMILLRSRTHAAIYEAALRQAHIPFTSAAKHQFWQSIETRDMVFLLRVLLSPFDNLALASVLRSPIFSCTNTDLSRLARESQPWWWHRLMHLTSNIPASHPMHRARGLLERWRSQVDKIPVHDLLDRIYNEGDILQRYRASAPQYLRQRIETNLNTLLELALESDGGRYPSLTRFLARLPLTATGEESGTGGSADNRVCIMTIHGAKGLESPAVFLVDAARPNSEQPASFRPVIDWPAGSRRPQHFLLAPKKAERDTVTARLLDTQQAADRREEANLLYVALSRAGQYLFISGCEPDKGGHAWYAHILSRAENSAEFLAALPAGFRASFGEAATTPSGQPAFLLAYGTPEHIDSPSTVEPINVPDPDPALCQVLQPETPSDFVNPSAADTDGLPVEGEQDPLRAEQARRRGIWIHRALERLPDCTDRNALYKKLAGDASRDLSHQDFDACWQNAMAIVDDTGLGDIFDSSRFAEAYNELPVLFQQGTTPVYGVLDRVVLTENEVQIIDYKTHENATMDNVDSLARSYVAQMQCYGDAVTRLWPARKVRLVLLFTRCRRRVEIPYAVDV